MYSPPKATLADLDAADLVTSLYGPDLRQTPRAYTEDRRAAGDRRVEVRGLDRRCCPPYSVGIGPGGDLVIIWED